MTTSTLDWKNVIDHLRSIGPFFFVHNGGNAGDALIYKGTLSLFEEHGLNSPELREARPKRGERHVVYGGGGNLVPQWGRCRRFIENQFDRLDSFTLLPHTINGNEDLLARMDERFTLFCREQVSFEHCRRHVGSGARVFLSHDLAFVLEPELRQISRDLLAERAKGSYPNADIKSQIKWWVGKWSARRFVDRGDHQFMRTDVEALNDAPKHNLDLPRTVSGQQKYPSQRLKSADVFLDCISRTQQVVTDRLHVAIAAVMLGKETILQPGSYYKNEAIHAHSIAPNFDKVTFKR